MPRFLASTALVLGLWSWTDVNAGCWTCEAELTGQGWAYVCVGLAIGQPGFQYCQPGAEWDDDVWCTFSGPYGDCTQGGGGGGWCPGCRHYPLSRNPILTTHVLVFDVADPLTSVPPRVMRSAGPEEFIRVASEQLDGSASLIGYSVETALGLTSTHYRSAQGEELGVRVTTTSGGFLVRLEQTGSRGRALSVSRTFVPEASAVAFEAVVDGRTCAVVVSPVVLDDGNQSDVDHRSFMDSAERFTPQEIALHAEATPAAVLGNRGVRAMCERMLTAALPSHQ